MNVLIDSREPPIVTEDFHAHGTVETVTVEELATGDIIIGDAVIERKEPSDMVSSIKDRRLFSQVRAMTEVEKLPLVLIEGNIEDFQNLTHTGFSPAAIRGAIASITARSGVPVIPCGDRLTLVDMALKIGQKTVDEESVAFSHDGFDTSGEVAPVVQMYVAIPGVGPGRARTLYEAYPAPEHLVRASEEDIRGLDGFGQKTARTVAEMVRGDFE